MTVRLLLSLPVDVVAVMLIVYSVTKSPVIVQLPAAVAVAGQVFSAAGVTVSSKDPVIPWKSGSPQLNVTVRPVTCALMVGAVGGLTSVRTEPVDLSVPPAVATVTVKVYAASHAPVNSHRPLPSAAGAQSVGAPGPSTATVVVPGRLL